MGAPDLLAGTILEVQEWLEREIDLCLEEARAEIIDGRRSRARMATAAGAPYQHRSADRAACDCARR
jgi:hypothetical protein